MHAYITLLFPTVKFIPDCIDKIYHYFSTVKIL